MNVVVTVSDLIHVLKQVKNKDNKLVFIAYKDKEYGEVASPMYDFDDNDEEGVFYIKECM